MSALNLDELWIGERVRLTKNGQRGRFEGITADGKAVKLFNKEVDLHFDETVSRAITSDQVLDWQLNRCRKHIETAIDKKVNTIIIIHGKGEGVLRNLVHQMLDSYSEVQWKMLINQGGATEVVFYYH